MRPAGLDLETTSPHPAEARIVEIAIVTPIPDLGVSTLVDPGIEIPPEATAVHGIDRAMIEELGAIPFYKIAERVRETLGTLVERDVPLAIYNAEYDLPILDRELRDALGIGVPEDLVIVDPYRYEAWIRGLTLDATYQRWTNRPLMDAHRAEHDAEATCEVFVNQRNAHPETTEHAITTPDEILHDVPASSDGKLRRVDGDLVFGFGKYEGEPVAEHPGYVDWILNNFDADEPVHRVLTRYRDEA